MQIYGIGTDIVQCARINKLWTEHGMDFARHILTQHEIEVFADQKSNHIGFLSKRFAAKEAVAKALGTGFRDNVFITQVGIETDSKGKPMVKFYDKTKDYVGTLSITDVHISISDESEYVVAFVIISS